MSNNTEKEKRKINKIGILILVIIIILILITGLTKARYQSKSTGSTVGRVAIPVVNLTKNTLELKINPSEKEKTYLFKVSNKENQNQSEVSMQYTLEIQSLNNIPLEFELYNYKDGVAENTNLLNNQNKTEVIPLKLHSEEKEYQLKIRWKGNVNLFIGGGDINNIYGAEEKNILASNTEKGNLNIKVYNGNIGGIFGYKSNEKIAGEANITFENFCVQDQETKYKEIRQIDNWSNVVLKESYLIVKNKDKNSQLTEIVNIGNLSVPNGSGLKLSANGTIAGNFYGGGELYLDSKICLTINGDISEVTKLILNPIVADGANIIQGGINYPYIKVAGNSKTKEKATKARARNLETESEDIVSGESNYKILTQQGKYSYYYIAENVEISNFVEIKSTNVANRVYTGNLGDKIGSSAENANILEIGCFTNQINLNYEFYTNSSMPNKYAKISRKLVLKTDQKEIMPIPAGTEILMLHNEKNYTYIATQDMQEIDLALFKEENGTNFIPESNLLTAKGTQKQSNELTKDTIYSYSENYRFIVNFANIVSQNRSIPAGTYYPMINIEDNGTSIGDEQKENTNKVNISKILFSPSSVKTDSEKYEKDGIVSITSSGTLKTYGGEGKQLFGNIKLYNTAGKRVDIPIGTKLTLNNQNCEIINGTSQAKFLENCTDRGSDYNLNFTMDMANVLKQNQLSEGDYKLVFEYRFAKDNLLDEYLAGWLEVPVSIINNANRYGLEANVQNDGSYKEDKLNLISKGKNETRIVNLTYTVSEGEPDTTPVEGAYVKTTVLEKTGEFEYTKTDNSKKIKIEGDMSFGEVTNSKTNSFSVNFESTVSEGTYRVLFELYDKYGNKKTESFVNFIVTENPQM